MLLIILFLIFTILFKNNKELFESIYYLQNTLFLQQRNNDEWIFSTNIMPGMLIEHSIENDDDRNASRAIYRKYVEHHKDWIERDSQANPLLDKNDARWLSFWNSRHDLCQ